MTDEEMIKAMEICVSPGMPCDDCPLVEQSDCDEISRQYFYKRFKELKAENAALRERLDKAVELPRVECIITKEWVNREMVGDRMFEWCVLYKKDGYLMVEPCLSKEAAEARLNELKGENNE